MYTISYVDRTNVSLALDPKISSMMHDLLMDDRMKGQAAGIFFLGYVLLQMAGGHLAGKWSAKKLVSLCLIFWGVCAVGCGLAKTFYQFEIARFLLGVSESCVFPATVVLLAHWFPSAERARANAFWNLCQPLAVVASAPVTGWLLGAYGWQTMLILEGALPFIWLPVWWFFISDHPRDAKWISAEERNFLETTLQREAALLEPPVKIPVLATAGAARNSGDDHHEFSPQLRGLRLHDFFHGRLEIEKFQPGAIWIFVRRALCHHRHHHGAQLVALGQNPRTARPCRVRLYVERRESDFERADAGTFLAVLRLHVPCDSRPVRRARAVLGDPDRNPAAQCFWPGHRPRQRARQHRRIFSGLTSSAGSRQEYHSTAIPFNALGIGMLLAAALAFLLPKSAKPIQAAAMPKT